MRQNCRCRLCGDRDKTINHIIRECNKLAQKEYKTKHDWELCKNFKFDETNKRMNNPDSVLENETQNFSGILQTDHLISARRLDLVIVYRKKKKKRKRKENVLNCGLFRTG